MCSETSEAVGTMWEHAQLEIQTFLKIRITLLVTHLPSWLCHPKFLWLNNAVIFDYHTNIFVCHNSNAVTEFLITTQKQMNPNSYAVTECRPVWPPLQCAFLCKHREVLSYVTTELSCGWLWATFLSACLVLILTTLILTTLPELLQTLFNHDCLATLGHPLPMMIVRV